MKKVFLIVSLLFQTSLLYAFELEDFNGAKTSLEEQIGQKKWSLFMFWAHDCGVCRAEFPLFSEFHNNRKDVDVIGISIDGESKKHLAEAFLERAKPSFPSYIASLTLVAANYEILTEENFRGTPTFLMFTPEGELLGNNPGKLSISALEAFIERNTPQS